MSRTVKISVITLSLFILLFVGMAYVLGKTTGEGSYGALAIYSEVLQRIQQDYVEEPNLSVVTLGGLHGLLESLDPRSSYLSPREYTDYKKKLEANAKGQVGAVLSKRFGYVVLVSVLPDGPAHKAGLRAGDILEGIAGFTTRDMSLGQSELLLHGDPGAAVKVSAVSRRFGSGTQPEEIEIVRREIAFPAVTVDRFEGDIAYLRVLALNAGKAAEIRQKIQQFEKQGLRRLVLDLRECAAGEVNEALETARLLVPAGTLATLRGQAFREQKFAAEPDKVAWRHDVSVLISNGTSGPAEVLAAALADNLSASGGKVELVGERTWGAASEQKVITLDDGAALILTVANYYRADGKSITEAGVTPTVEIEASVADAGASGEGTAGRDASAGAAPPSGGRAVPADDPALRKAIELFTAPKPAEKKGQARVAPRRFRDLAA